MKVSFRVKDKKTGEFIDDGGELMERSGLNLHMDFEDIGIQSDGTPVIFDKCGGFSYLNTDIFELVTMFAREG